MNTVIDPAPGSLHVTYTIHDCLDPASSRLLVLHHGICHTRDHFLPLIERLNRLRIRVAMIDQQSENAGTFRNFIGVRQYREGMAAAVAMIEQKEGRHIGSYALHSMGAIIGEEMQQKYSKLRRPTVLMAPIPINGALPITLRILKRHPLSYLKAVLTLDIHSLAESPAEVRELFFDDEASQSDVEQATAQLKHAPFCVYCQLVLRPLVRPRIDDDKKQKLLLYSQTDEIFHPYEYEKTKKRYPKLEHGVITGGHDFFISSVEATAQRLADFHLANSKQSIPRHHMSRQPESVKPADADAVS